MHHLHKINTAYKPFLFSTRSWPLVGLVGYHSLVSQFSRFLIGLFDCRGGTKAQIQPCITPKVYPLETRSQKHKEIRQMLEGNEMKVLRKIINKKIDRIWSQQNELCGIQPINEWLERRREWDEHVTRMDAETIINISRDNIPAGRGSPRTP